MLFEKDGEADTSDLLLALDEEAHVQWQRPVPPPERLRYLERHEERPLVVARPASVDAAVAHRRLERRTLPRRLVAGRLHVVVRVDENRGRARGAQPFGEHERMPRGLDHPTAEEGEL